MNIFEFNFDICWGEGFPHLIDVAMHGQPFYDHKRLPLKSGCLYSSTTDECGTILTAFCSFGPFTLELEE